MPSILFSLLPHSWQTAAGQYVPMEAGSQIFIAVHHNPDNLSAWTGFGVFCLYAAAALAVAFVAVNHRDA